jgi:hypothetical protein
MEPTRREADEDEPELSRADAYLDAFQRRNSEFRASGLCGRFIRGVNNEQLSKLSDEPGKVLSWVLGDELLQSILGMTALEAMVHIGFGLDWVQARLSDGTTFRLVVFPVGPETSTTLATWDNLLALARDAYPAAVADRLAPHLESLKTRPIESIDPELRLREISNLPVESKMVHPEYITAERFLALVDSRPASLYEARAFFDHALGACFLFRGDGRNAEGQSEYMTRNRLLSEIPGARWLDLDVTLAEIEELRCRVPASVAGSAQ